MTELTDEAARHELVEVQAAIEGELRIREQHESNIADNDYRLVKLRQRERELMAQLTPERSGVPRVIRKA